MCNKRKKKRRETFCFATNMREALCLVWTKVLTRQHYGNQAAWEECQQLMGSHRPAPTQTEAGPLLRLSLMHICGPWTKGKSNTIFFLLYFLSVHPEERQHGSVVGGRHRSLAAWAWIPALLLTGHRMLGLLFNHWVFFLHLLKVQDC
jgi:hypothetical protein